MEEEGVVVSIRSGMMTPLSRQVADFITEQGFAISDIHGNQEPIARKAAIRKGSFGILEKIRVRRPRWLPRKFAQAVDWWMDVGRLHRPRLQLGNLYLVTDNLCFATPDRWFMEAFSGDCHEAMLQLAKSLEERFNVSINQLFSTRFVPHP